MKQRARENFIYLGVALLVVGVFCGPLLYLAVTRRTVPDVPMVLIWGTVSTLGILALLLDHFWKERRQPAVWVGCSVITIANICFVWIVYRNWRTVPLVLLAFVSALLLTLAVTLLRRVMLRYQKSNNAEHC
jgi:drug/metabolite transporter (DMT)-like permease